MPTTLTRPNRYPAACIRCGGRVEAEAGFLARTDRGDWAADHDGPCPERRPAPTPVARVAHDGIYRDDTGRIFKVQEARQGNGRLYAKLLVLTTCTERGCGHPTVTQPDGHHTHGHFTYAAGAIHSLRADQQLPLAEAAEFGRLYGVCVACGADLTDENSIARGLGPICAGKF